MKATIRPSYNQERKNLSDIIPLSTPFTIYLEPTRFCNLKCYYCMHSTRDDPNGEFFKSGYVIKHISPELFQLFLEQASYFPEKIKRLVLSGLGEPLINPEIPNMIKYANDSGIFERIDILTNGILLKPNISDALVANGVSRIQISLQGLDNESYFKYCGYHIDYESFLDNLKYIYNNRRKTKIFIKIIDSMVPSKAEKQKFYSMFGNLCDEIFIEHLITLEQQMVNLHDEVDDSRNLNNELFIPRKVCSVPFYHLNINADGDVFPCPPPGLPKFFAHGNINSENLVDIWNGKKRLNFLKAQLKVGREHIKWCDTCVNYSCISTPEENLDPDTEILLKKIRE